MATADPGATTATGPCGSSHGRRVPASYDDRVTLEFTDWAIEILQRTHEAARRFNAAATVRIHRTGDGVAFDLTDELEDGDELVTENGFELWVASGLEGTVDVVEPHDRLVLRRPGDPERSVRSAH
jgi:hypothetical protein